MAGTIKLEKLGVPGVFINCDTFEHDASSAAADNAMPAVRHRRWKSSEFYKLRGQVDTVRPLVETIYPELIESLTAPLTPAETASGQPGKEEIGPAEIKVTGEDYPAAAEEFNRIYLENRWGDGLPLVPPTPERVRWMLSGTKRDPQEVLGKINPKHGIATVEKIAINAVMAGARPEYLPVIITALEILTDKDFDDLHILASAGSFNMLIIVSGPIAKEIGMEGGIGFMGHGWRANNTIGRAIRLATLNIGHTWPAVNDMALTGRVSAHTFYTFPENADASVWEPYHVGRGFKTDDSCVTVAPIYGDSPISRFYGGMIGTWTAEGIIERMVDDLKNRGRRGYRTWGAKGVGPFRGSGGGAHNYMIILFPELVAEFKKMGFDQTGLQKEVYKRTSVPFEELDEADIKGIREAMEYNVLPTGQKPIFEAAMKPGGMVPVMLSPESLHFFVAGGAPGCAFSFSYHVVPPYNHTALLTRAITGAALTRAGA